jgi:hypothetical protein
MYINTIRIELQKDRYNSDYTKQLTQSFLKYIAHKAIKWQKVKDYLFVDIFVFQGLKT